MRKNLLLVVILYVLVTFTVAILDYLLPARQLFLVNSGTLFGYNEYFNLVSNRQFTNQPILTADIIQFFWIMCCVQLSLYSWFFYYSGVMGYAGGAGMGVALPQSVYGVLLQAQGLSNTGAATYAAFIASPMWGILFVCLKCLFVFLLLVLVRVTTPKFKMETITKFGWLYSLTLILGVFCCYSLGFFIA